MEEPVQLSPKESTALKSLSSLRLLKKPSTVSRARQRESDL